MHKRDAKRNETNQRKTKKLNCDKGKKDRNKKLVRTDTHSLSHNVENMYSEHKWMCVTE